MAAVITLACAGLSVLVLEAKDTIGGGIRSAELTLPGFLHDICSAIHPLSLGSPFFLTIPLAEHGLEWVHPPAALAHPLDDGTAIIVEHSVALTAEGLGPDANAYLKLMPPPRCRLSEITARPARPAAAPASPARVGPLWLRTICPADSLARSLFQGDRARALFAGMAAHSMLPLERPTSASFGLVLSVLAHALGWPMARSGSQRIAAALADYLRSLSGEIITGRNVESLDDHPLARASIFDVTPRQLLHIDSGRLPAHYRSRLARYRYCPGVFKLDLALDGPILWKAEACERAATVHPGRTPEEIAASERAVWQGKHPQQPFLLLAQVSLFDATRTPEEMHMVWAYCHVPNGSTFDMTERIEDQWDVWLSRCPRQLCAHGRYRRRAPMLDRWQTHLQPCKPPVRRRDTHSMLQT